MGIFDMKPKAEIGFLLERITDYNIQGGPKVRVNANETQRVLLECCKREKRGRPVVLGMMGMEQVVDHAVDIAFRLG